MTDTLYMEWVEDQPDKTPFVGQPRELEAGIVSFQPTISMDTTTVSNMHFIDLKSKHPLTNEVNVVALNQKLKFVPSTRNRALHVLPNPVIGLSDAKKRPEKSQTSKVFDEDISPIPIDDDDDNFGVSIRKEKQTAFTPPATTYTEGEVKCTTIDALKEMVQQLSCIKQDTGCIINETCDPECYQYTEDTHFVAHTNLGHGSFGKVDLCYDSKTNKPFVRKKMQKCNLRASEVIVPTTIDHPNITRFFGLVLRESSVNCDQAIMELYLEYGGDSLTKVYSDGRRFDHTQIRGLTKQGLAGLMHLNRYNIIHLDIKPENICILAKNGTLQLKITDFGSSRLPIDCLEFVGVTPEYMAPEMCQLYLQRQQSLGLDWSLEESDITGKVDVFAFALVAMYMYKGYHILVKVFNNGNPTYENMDVNRRRSLHFNLMIQMAKDTDYDFFVQNLIPDECSLDMRDLLIGMTQHKHSTRVSARHAFEQIEVFEKRCKSNLSAERKAGALKQKLPPQNILYIPDQTNNSIPDVAEDCMESETGPVKNRTIGLLRRKLQPYEKCGHFGKGSKNMAPMSPQQEMYNIRQEIASKKLQMPATPIAAFEELCLGQALPTEPTVQRISGTTERNAPLAQPSMDTSPAPMVDIRGQKGAVCAVYEVETQNSMARHGHSIVVEESNGGCFNSVNNVLSSVRNTGVAAASSLQQYVQISPEVLLKFLQKKASAQQRAVKKEPEIQPPVINLREFVPIGNRRQTRNIQQQRHPPSEMPMEERGQAPGNLPNLADFL